jgi:radical SAM protein with 4Fe4S-binding SPASM domain
MVACHENHSEIGPYLRLAQSLGADEARIIPLKRLGNAANGAPTPLPQMEILKAVRRELDRDSRLEKLCRSDLYAILKAVVRGSSARRTCGSGTQTLLVQADGRLYPCINSTIPRAMLGTIDDEPEMVFGRGEDWGDGLSVANPQHPCHGCCVKRWCLGGCPGETLQRTEALACPHWNCADLKQALVYMMWLATPENCGNGPSRSRI